MTQRGIFAVCKPSGVRSAQVVARIKAVLLQKRHEKPVQGQDPNLKLTATTNRDRTQRGTASRATRLKVGHGGTLDQLAEGVLVIAVGQDCKKLSEFLKGDKCYVATGQLGKSTDTCDAGGTVTEQKPYDHVQRMDLERTLKSFRGETFQAPPAYSALKHQGMRFSDLARSGVVVEPQPRRITIHSMSLEDFQPPYFTISVFCASGTYIRSLIRDIGLQLGTVACVTELVRTRQGVFSLKNALPEGQWTVDGIQAAVDKTSRTH